MKQKTVGADEDSTPGIKRSKNLVSLFGKRVIPGVRVIGIAGLGNEESDENNAGVANLSPPPGREPFF